MQKKLTCNYLVEQTAVYQSFGYFGVASMCLTFTLRTTTALVWTKINRGLLKAYANP
jgi:hypothetical protein